MPRDSLEETPVKGDGDGASCAGDFEMLGLSLWEERGKNSG